MPPRRSVRRKRPAMTRAYPDKSVAKRPRRSMHASSEVNVVAQASQDDSRILALATCDLQQVTLHPDVLHKLSDSISTAIINGLKANTSVEENAQVASVAAPQWVNESNSEVESAVQGSVTGALNVLSGGTCINTHLDKPGALFNSASVPIGAKITAKIKQKILAHEYIDFGILLNKITPEVQSYQLLASRGGGWRYYDKNFRHLMQEHHSTLAWDAVHWELWLRGTAFSHKQVSFTGYFAQCCAQSNNCSVLSKRILLALSQRSVLWWLCI